MESEGFHGFLLAAHRAFMDHRPLVLSPDDVWVCIAQGFAIHVDQIAETLRRRLVPHEGQAKIIVIRNEFRRGSPDNDWQGCFREFSDEIGSYLGSTRDLITAGFSTTGAIEKAASEIVLMAAMRHYFDYELVTRCGIPNVTLLGTEEDWRSIRRRAEALTDFDLGWWMRALLPVLDQFVAAAEGRADREFWRSFYKWNGFSGGPFVSGWINALFPYLEGRARVGSPLLVRNDGVVGLMHEGINADRFPSGMSVAPFIWDYFGIKIPMKLFGGFAGVSQDPETLALRPAIGWAVAEDVGSGG
ncbi:DUF4419 domain-containing protein [Luteolibacter arcticus]|uniref:DUF4419 domain-containing protein n=1 Tax=Luteolibacter arcticus TaxID=1581411 RepID=A0ABT3GGW9_9BACT|nr:DUF4419 domain-containing protein [Luteolibacter arcticus]